MPLEPEPKNIAQMSPLEALLLVRDAVAAATKPGYGGKYCPLCDAKLVLPQQRETCSTAEHVQKEHAKYVRTALDRNHRASALAAELYKLDVPAKYRRIDDLLIPDNDGGGPYIPHHSIRYYSMVPDQLTPEKCWKFGAWHREYKWNSQQDPRWNAEQILAYRRGYDGEPLDTTTTTHE
jgi:hypothetical protein